MKLSDYVMLYLRDKGVRTIFGYQGSSVSHLIDSLHRVGHLRYVQNNHEQASAFSANAYAQISGGLGVALSCSGPGATNLITGIANAYFDSLPCVFITGQVGLAGFKTHPLIRQHGFQETDIASIVKPITKFVATIFDPKEIRYNLEKAVYLAQEGRPGSVLVDIPHNVQTAEIEPESLTSFFDSEEYTTHTTSYDDMNDNTIHEVHQLLTSAKRPVVLLGGGSAHLKGTGLIETFISEYHIPVVASLRGLDIFSHDHECFSGFVGAYGNRYANFCVACSDVLLVLGSRLDTMQTGADIRQFARRANIIHVDIDIQELNRIDRNKTDIHCDVGLFLGKMVRHTGSRNVSADQWLETVGSWKRKYPSGAQSGTPYVNPNEIISALGAYLTQDAIICCDVGLNQMYVAQSIRLNGRRSLLNSGGHGAMGYSLPAAIGAYSVSMDRQIICIVGDGGIQMNSQELHTIAKERIPAKVIIMNNSSLGMIRAYQEKALAGKTYGSVDGFSSPDYHKIAGAYGFRYFRVSSMSDFRSSAPELTTVEPCIYEVLLDPNPQINPGPAYQRPVEDQFPFIDREEYQQIMSLADTP
jgi:acetolactate synthase-1/2/3 large subunit